MAHIDVQRLSAAERFVLWSLRVALSPKVTTETANQVLTHAFRTLNLAQALPSLLAMSEALVVIWHDVQRVPDMHCTCCKVLGRDELCLLQSLAALQLRELDLASSHLANLLPLAGIRIVLPRAMYFAGALSSAGWTLRQAELDACNAPYFSHDGSKTFIH